MSLEKAASIIVLDPDISEARQIAHWLRSAGLGHISVARTCDEAIFMLGRKNASLLIIDDRISEKAERRLLRHLGGNGHTVKPALVRIVGDASPCRLATGREMATEIIRKPLVDHDVVVRIGTAMQRPDLIGKHARERDQSREHIDAAQRMQIGLLPTTEQLRNLHETCGVGVAALYRSGEAVGGDFWSIWPLGQRRFAMAIADFAGHGLSAALNTFRLHALLSDQTLPRAQPKRMMALLNERLHAMLPRGQYATMIYLVVDPVKPLITWCSAGGPEPIFAAADRQIDLYGSGLPLGVKPDTVYRDRRVRFPQSGVLGVFSDGLFESGANAPDVPRSAIAQALVEAARQAETRPLTLIAQEATQQLALLREQHQCPDHSDDIVAICVAFAPAPPSEGRSTAHSPPREDARNATGHIS